MGMDGNSSLGEGVGCGVLLLCLALAIVLVMWAAQSFPGLR